jgi:rhodanese-related sulfurtransferase
MRKTINVQELCKLIETDNSLQLIDVRSPGEYASGHLPRAINIPLEQADARIDDLGNGPVAILCHSGNRATMASDMLREHHPNLLVVEGGTQAWIQAGKPVTAAVGSRWSLERQVRLIAGVIVLVGTTLAMTIGPAWTYLAMFVGAGLTFAGLTNVCGMALLLGKLPWNQPAKHSIPRKEVQA